MSWPNCSSWWEQVHCPLSPWAAGYPAAFHLSLGWERARIEVALRSSLCFQCIISYSHKVGALLPIPGFQKNLCDMERFFSLWPYHPDRVQSLQRPARGRRVTIGWYDWAQDCLTAGHAPCSLSWLTARQIACFPWLSILPLMGCPSSLDVGQWCLELTLVSRTVCPPLIPLPHCPYNLKQFRSEKEDSQALEAAHNLMPNICAMILFKNKHGRHRQTWFFVCVQFRHRIQCSQSRHSW